MSLKGILGNIGKKTGANREEASQEYKQQIFDRTF
jgi:hypothetical protein